MFQKCEKHGKEYEIMHTIVNGELLNFRSNLLIVAIVIAIEADEIFVSIAIT